MSFFLLLDDFFVGIGDINSAFLPKQRSTLAELPKASDQASQDPVIDADEVKINSTSLSVADESAAISEQNETLDHQILDKPLARMQEEKSAALHEALDHAKSDCSSVPPLPDAVDKAEEAVSLADPLSSTIHDAASPDMPLRSTSTTIESDVVSDSSDSESDTDGEDGGLGPASVQAANGSGVKVHHDTPATSSPSAPGLSQATDGEATPIPPEDEAVLHDDDNELERVLDVCHVSYQGMHHWATKC